jgi:hypothetical protein
MQVDGHDMPLTIISFSSDDQRSRHQYCRTERVRENFRARLNASSEYNRAGEFDLTSRNHTSIAVDKQESALSLLRENCSLKIRKIASRIQKFASSGLHLKRSEIQDV